MGSYLKRGRTYHPKLIRNLRHGWFILEEELTNKTNGSNANRTAHGCQASTFHTLTWLH